MKKLAPVFLIIVIVSLTSCQKERPLCDFNQQKVDCGYLNLFQQLVNLEQKINASLRDEVELTTQEELELREQWMDLYNSNKDSLIAAFDSLEPSNITFDMLYKMRKKEVESFKDQLEYEVRMKEFLKQLETKQEQVVQKLTAINMVDTLDYFIVKNNSDSTIKSLQIRTRVYKNGEEFKDKTAYHVLSKSNIYPEPKEGEPEYLVPGGTARIHTGAHENITVKMELVGVTF